MTHCIFPFFTPSIIAAKPGLSKPVPEYPSSTYWTAARSANSGFFFRNPSRSFLWLLMLLLSSFSKPFSMALSSSLESLIYKATVISSILNPPFFRFPDLLYTGIQALILILKIQYDFHPFPIIQKNLIYK